jgi:hypothetical protein
MARPVEYDNSTRLSGFFNYIYMYVLEIIGDHCNVVATTVTSKVSVSIRHVYQIDSARERMDHVVEIFV